MCIYSNYLNINKNIIIYIILFLIYFEKKGNRNDKFNNKTQLESKIFKKKT